jgi:hypothetical protein
MKTEMNNKNKNVVLRPVVVSSSDVAWQKQLSWAARHSGYSSKDPEDLQVTKRFQAFWTPQKKSRMPFLILDNLTGKKMKIGKISDGQLSDKTIIYYFFIYNCHIRTFPPRNTHS